MPYLQVEEYDVAEVEEDFNVNKYLLKTYKLYVWNDRFNFKKKG